MSKKVSIVIPAYNEQDNLVAIVDRLENIMEGRSYNFEIILVDDGSKDKTLSVIKAMTLARKNIFYIEFSRNFGHQPALKAGLDHADGDCVISLDADLQHPPELLVQMLEKWEEGYEVVYTRRHEDRSLPYKKRVTSSLYYRLLNSLSDIEIEPGTADFRLMDKKVVDVFKEFNENEPFIRGLIKWMGFKQFAIDYTPNQRFSGESKYNVSKMLRLAMHGVTSFSIKPLYTAVYLGFIFSFLSVLYIPYVLHALYTGKEVDGWASTIVTIVFFGGLHLIILGIIGIYMGKMFLQSKNRPNYIIRSSNLVNLV
ncbi:glycosyltransferase family 2 protein [Pedobacter nutrimenti]|jgi:dolichol-phosphate mannosyltransferase|uniref:Dolichol-phosphate mannosyltransferase n=1 Tax=Pedobacter nutrimenti TaxID=1241337 RepID=A0A318U963_9SPHI|nr:glycosyltransferase family 2 protein [Pedobacter nutrimenti]PYF68869.1 dolichol-phosphate mannosyltransferase [Pedobacter nutrimenti]|eukprot:gene9332-10938_t